MIIKAQQAFTRQTPRKLRLVANIVKKLSLADAVRQLTVIERKATIGILKVVRQAIANATHNHGLKVEELQLKNILITEGPRFRRFRAVSRGRAHNVLKRTSHITVELESGLPAQAKTVAAKPVEAPKKVTTKAAEVAVSEGTATTKAAPAKAKTKVSTRKAKTAKAA